VDSYANTCIGIFLPVALLLLLAVCPAQHAQTNAAGTSTEPVAGGSKFKDPLNRETPQSAVTAFLVEDIGLRSTRLRKTSAVPLHTELRRDF
jgi:hypothetical protein